MYTHTHTHAHTHTHTHTHTHWLRITSIYADVCNPDYLHFFPKVAEDLKYGNSSDHYAWIKVDHCQFIDPESNLSPVRDATNSTAQCAEVRTDNSTLYCETLKDTAGCGDLSSTVPARTEGAVEHPSVSRARFLCLCLCLCLCLLSLCLSVSLSLYLSVSLSLCLSLSLSLSVSLSLSLSVCLARWSNVC